MVDIKTLLPELQKLVRYLAEDMLQRAMTELPIDQKLRSCFQPIKEGERSSQSFEEWREDYLDQVAVAWVLACVFVRFIEDNGLLDECWLAGEGERRSLADGHYEIYFRNNPHGTDREFLKYVFKEIGKIPAAKELFEEGKTALWAVDPSGDAARTLLNYFKEIDAEAGGLKRSFSASRAKTGSIVDVYEKLAPQAQFLGDLYQDLSEHARKKYALKQTPEFIQQFILDRTLTPALDQFGLKNLRLIDPACGSGHFLLGAFDRLFEEWMKPEYGVNNPVVAAQNALDSIFGTDLNPFAIAITRFRLLVAAIQACNIRRLHQQSYAWKLNLAVGDSLLWGKRPSFNNERVPISQQRQLFDVDPIFAVENPDEMRRILGQGYNVVVGNPPYITVKDKAQNEAYRSLYTTCHRQYSLGVPFTQRFWELAIRQGECINGKSEELSHSPGFIGMITANSFMKREFGKKLIEEFFPQTDLTHVIDTSGAYIPGHGTPTVILFGRPRKSVDLTVRAVLGIKGEPSTPDDPSQGLVWKSIVKQIDVANAQDEFSSTADIPRETFAKHPWSIGGGGVGDLKDAIETISDITLGDIITDIGRSTHTGEDDIFYMEPSACRTQSLFARAVPLVEGESVRDYIITFSLLSLFPYDKETGVPIDVSEKRLAAHFWQYRTTLKNRKDFGQFIEERGLRWFDHSMFFPARYRSPLSIAFAFVATHNHFVLDRGGKVFKQTAPIIKLPIGATEDAHLGLLGLLNSSTACFWMHQVCHNKGRPGANAAAADERWEFRFEYDGTKLRNFPISEKKPIDLAGQLDRLAQEYASYLPDSAIKASIPTRDRLGQAFMDAEATRCRMIAVQEELDWLCYHQYGLVSDDLRYFGDDLPEVKLGERAFEIIMARKIANAELETSWFSRFRSTPITELPTCWPAAYRKLVERRIKIIETDKSISLIEAAEFKRRWQTDPWEDQEEQALRNWLLDRLETPKYRNVTKDRPELTTTAQMADVASADAEFLQVATLFRGRPDFDVVALVAELVEGEAVPFLPVLRYKPSGLRKREVWERTWDLQRQQDSGKDVGDIPVPSKYTSVDFLKADHWRLRGKLDVPKERWISYPHCSTDSDPTLVVSWAGWNHLQQATALIAYYDARKREGWDTKRLTPLLAGLDQLLPWIHQWHPEIDVEFGETAGQSFQTMLEHDAHELGVTVEDIRRWTPPERTRKIAKGRKKKAVAEDDE